MHHLSYTCSKTCQKNSVSLYDCIYIHSYTHTHHTPLAVLCRATCYWQFTDLPGQGVVVPFVEMREPPSGPAQSVALWLWDETVSRGALSPLTT